MLRKLISYIREFRTESRGSVILVFAFALIPILILSGIVIDYARASNVRTVLAAAADSAVLAAVSHSQIKLPIPAARRAAEALFDANAAAADVKGINRSIQISERGTTREATASYQVSVPSMFAPFIGVEAISVGGTASATGGRQPYMDFYLLLDNSPSMGVAATYEDINRLNRATGCAFACHILSEPDDAFRRAKRLGVTLRIDVVRDAAQRLTEKASATAQIPGQYRMGIYTLGPNCAGKRLTTVKDLSGDLAAVRAEASRIELMATPRHRFDQDRCTDFNSALRAMNRIIDTPGAGLQASQAQKVMYLVSDGVADYANDAACTEPLAPFSENRCQEPLDWRYCEVLKKRGVRIAVLYTTYLPLTGEWWYNNTIAPWISKVAPSMKRCASPNLYFEVAPNQGLAEAMKALFDQVVANSYLGQ